MVVDAEDFLNTEEAVHELSTQLERLKQEIEGYGRAKGTLEDVRNQMGTAALKLAQLAEQSRLIIEALGKIGTPEILARIAKVEHSTQQYSQAIHTLTGEAKAFQQQVSGQTSSAMDLLGQRIHDAIESLKAFQADLATEAKVSKAFLEQRIRRLVWLLSVPAAVTVGVAIYLLIRSLLLR